MKSPQFTQGFRKALRVSEHKKVVQCFAKKLTDFYDIELVHDCTVHKVPFPALETMEDRKMFPTRYFLFFDTFVRAGRHNRSLWKKAIRENNGKNNKRFGPAIFEAHVRTTVRENYFKWIFQQLSDIHEIDDKGVDDFRMEYDESVFSNLPRTLVCNHRELTKFPFKNCQIDFGGHQAIKASVSAKEEHEEGDDDNDSYCSANSVDSREGSTSPTPALVRSGEMIQEENSEEGHFFLVYKHGSARRFNELQEQQRKNISKVAAKAKEEHQEILGTLRETILKIREVKKSVPDTDTLYKDELGKAKRKLRLFKDVYDNDSGEGQLRKKRRRSIENHTRFSDSKVTFFSKSNDEMKTEEQSGLRESWEALYKEVWNKHLLAPKEPIITTPIPKVTSIIRDMENDVNQLLADYAGVVEQV
jgi:hypothetical protein